MVLGLQRARSRLLPCLFALGALSCGGASAGAERKALPAGQPMAANARIGYLHHSTGGVVWGGGVEGHIQAWNSANAKTYRITSVTYPDTGLGGGGPNYPWNNYPYDYWNLWVAHTGANRDRGEQTLDDLVDAYDLIVWKHCYPVSGIGPDSGNPSVSSEAKTTENYRLQYQALKARMRQFPDKRFLVWTGAALRAADTDAASAQRARDFFLWVKNVWDEPGDSIFVWDFFELETQGGNVLAPAYSTGDSHPNATFAALAAPLVGKRIVDVLEGRGDTGSLTGQ